MLELDLSTVDTAMTELCREGRIPGAGLAIVKGEEVIKAGAYGFRDLHNQLLLDIETQFPIGSITKSLTATLLGILVEEGRLDWDVPVQHYLPQFALSDPIRSPLVTVRDLLTMRTGLPRHDWVWLHDTVARQEIPARLRHLGLSAGFREKFQYNNHSYIVAGVIAEVVTGQSWEELIKDKILSPLHLTSTTMGPRKEDDHLCSYHENALGELVATSPYLTSVAGPAGGSIHSTLRDMAKWLSLNMTGNLAGKGGLVSSSSLTEIQTGQTVMSGFKAWNGVNPTYGFGWIIDHFSGHRRISHSGYLRNVSSDISIYPDIDVGFFSYTNFGCAISATAINEFIFQRLTGAQSLISTSARIDAYVKQRTEFVERNANVARHSGASPSHPLQAYTGRFSDGGYGPVDVILRDGGLVLQRGHFMVPLDHWHFDFWSARPTDQMPIHLPHPFEPSRLIKFETGMAGSVEAVQMHLELEAAPTRFIRVDSNL